MSDKLKTIYVSGEKEKENQKPKKPGVIKTSSEKPKVKITGPGAAVLLLLATMISALAQPGIIPQPGTQSSVFTNRLLTTLNGSGVTNRLYFTNASAAFGPTNAIHIKTNSSSQRWEWLTAFSTVVATNDFNRPTGSWHAVSGGALYGQTRYEPRSPQTIANAPAATAPNPAFVQVDTSGVVVSPENFWEANAENLGSPDALTNNYDGTITATEFVGAGTGLTGLNGANITSGPVGEPYIAASLVRRWELQTNAVPPVFNVIGFGAKGDGVTEDTAAILSAFAAAKAAGGGIVYFPAVTNFYSVKLSGNAGAINVTNAHNITVLGDGDSSFVKCVDAVNNNVAVFKIWLSTNFNMRNIRVSGGADVRAFSSLENEGVNLIFCTNGVMENVTVERVLADAWDLDWCYGFTWHNPVSRNIGGSGWKPNGFNFTLFGGMMDNCGKTATEADRGGLVIPDAYGVSVFGTIVTNCNPSIYLSGAQKVLVEGVHCWMTNNTFTNIYVFGGTDQNISGCTFTGGYGVWTTNNIGGSSGPTGLTLSENKFWTTTMLHVQTDVTDLQVFGNKHVSGLNPLGSVTAHSIFLVDSIRSAIQKNNIRVNGTAIYFTGVNHEMQVSDNYFGTYVSQAIYAPNNSAVATNFYAANNVFNQAGVNSISFSDSVSVSNGVFTGNLMKGMFRLQGGSHYISGNKLESGMLIYNTACISNVIIGNHFGNTNWYASQVPQNSYWLNNTGDASATTNNADYIALRFTRGWLNSSNTVASWLASPRYAGDVYFPPASNGVQYVLYSTNGAGAATTAWTRTNYFGP